MTEPSPPPQTSPTTQTRRVSDTGRNALVFMAVILGGAALYWLGGILEPLALALFLVVMIDGLSRVIDHRVPGCPKWAALTAAIVISIVAMGLAIFLIAENGAAFVTQLFTYGPKLNDMFVTAATAIGIKAPPTLVELMHRLNPTQYLGRVAQGLQGVATRAVLVLIYTGFLLASRQNFARKAASLFNNPEERTGALRTFLRVRNGIERYLWVQTVTGGIIAIGSWVVMMAVGLDNALFWAFLIFLVSYVPVLGGAVGILVPSLFALVQFDSFWPALILLVVVQSIHFTVGNILLPRLQGETLNLDPVVILLSLAFWGSIWGLTGMFLSTPLTVMTMVVLAQFGGSRWIAVLLSADGDPLGEKDSEADHPSGGKAKRK